MIAAHFKNGKTKHFLSEIMQEYKSGKTLQLKKCQWFYGGRLGGISTTFHQRAYEP